MMCVFSREKWAKIDKMLLAFDGIGGLKRVLGIYHQAELKQMLAGFHRSSNEWRLVDQTAPCRA